jgi:hypothetical protein
MINLSTRHWQHVPLESKIKEKLAPCGQKAKAHAKTRLTSQVTRPAKAGLGRRYAAPVLSTLCFFEVHLD